MGAQPLAEEAMHRQVGVAANGRSEMTVVVAGQRVVAFVNRAVDGLFEAAQ